MVEEDIPKMVILVLLVLTIIISALGTWTVLDAVSRAQPSMVPESRTRGDVMINILPTEPGAEEPQASDAQGVVGLTVVE